MPIVANVPTACLVFLRVRGPEVERTGVPLRSLHTDCLQDSIRLIRLFVAPRLLLLWLQWASRSSGAARWTGGWSSWWRSSPSS